MTAHEAAWQDYFDTIDIQPMMVVYEELAEAYEETALKMLHYLDIPVPDDLVFAPRKMKRQADAFSEAWVKQYYQHKK
jgi:LPS sulfotransferase NodH